MSHRLLFSCAVLQELREPLEPIAVAHLAHDGAHIQFNRADRGGLVVLGLLSIGLVQTQLVPQVLLGRSRAQVDLVAQHQEGHVGQLVREQQGLDKKLNNKMH